VLVILWEDNVDEFSVSYENKDEYTLVRVSGDLTLATTHELTKALNNAAAESGAHRFILDMGEVAAVDSNGLAALVGAYQTANANDGFVRLLNIRAGLLETLYFTRLEKLFPRFTTVEEALASSEA
jgi:anti-sigma B factor antagonist